MKINLWSVQNPKGYILTSTLSVKRKTAVKRALSTAEQKYNGLVTHNFKKWEKLGYKVVKGYYEVK